MNLTVWGARGSVATPGPQTNRYGGNTSCVALTLSDGRTVILDAGTGIRALGLALSRQPEIGDLDILLTHLHLDHIQGLMFFAPLFVAERRITIWGPESPEASLEERIGRYISAPLAPVEVRELPCTVAFRECPATEWEIGPARVRAQAVTHRGPTLGYRITDGGASLCYIPDHEPGLGGGLGEIDPEWISGFDLAHDASLLIHDCQYLDEEYPEHLGWGHSSLSDALTFAQRAAARRVLLFHHDPQHDDATLDGVAARAARAWEQLGGRAEAVGLAAEGMALELDAPVPA
jgi:phosphoribosyl 1,2-cyclic phosphodiesterase